MEKQTPYGCVWFSMDKKKAKEIWLDAALDCLAREGVDRIKIERLATTLDLTKGSFYWHFKNRSALLEAMVDYWEQRQWGFLNRLKTIEAANPADRLWQVFQFIDTKDARHDIAIRLWSWRAEWVRRIVTDIDQARLVFLEGLFKEMGFAQEQARLRARLTYFYQVAEQNIDVQDTKSERKTLSRARFALLCRKDTAV